MSTLLTDVLRAASTARSDTAQSENAAGSSSDAASQLEEDTIVFPTDVTMNSQPGWTSVHGIWIVDVQTVEKRDRLISAWDQAKLSSSGPDVSNVDLLRPDQFLNDFRSGGYKGLMEAFLRASGAARGGPTPKTTKQAIGAWAKGAPVTAASITAAGNAQLADRVKLLERRLDAVHAHQTKQSVEMADLRKDSTQQGRLLTNVQSEQRKITQQLDGIANSHQLLESIWSRVQALPAPAAEDPPPQHGSKRPKPGGDGTGPHDDASMDQDDDAAAAGRC